MVKKLLMGLAACAMLAGVLVVVDMAAEALEDEQQLYAGGYHESDYR